MIKITLPEIYIELEKHKKKRREQLIDSSEITEYSQNLLTKPKMDKLKGKK